MKIVIITTPNESLKETGFGSIEACNSVLNSTIKAGYTAEIKVCKTTVDLQKIVDKKPDLVVLAIKYLAIKDGKDIWLSQYFEDQNVNFSGSLKETLIFDSDKVGAKLHLLEQGLKTANFFTAIPGQYICKSELPISFPLFLKPLDAANGNGIDDASLVHNFSEFQNKLLSLYEIFKQPILVEEYLDGPEFTVAIINTQKNGIITSIIEVIPPKSSNGHRILNGQVKKEDSETFKKAEDIRALTKVRKLALDVFTHLGVRDFGRIDIKTNKLGECFFMEANLVPGMTAGSSYFPKAFEMTHGYSYDKVIELVIEGGLNRIPIRIQYAKDYAQQVIPSVAMHQVFLRRCSQLISRWS